jgi:hypothetical protein
LIFSFFPVGHAKFLGKGNSDAAHISRGEMCGLSAEARASRCDRYKPLSTSSLVAPLCVLTRRRIELSVPMRKTWWSGTGNRW